jgi:hypothetical protein
MKPSAARVGKQTAKFEAKTMPGIFLGYLVQPGGRWVGDFAVAPFAPLRECKLEEQWKAASVHNIKEVYYNKDKEAEFPLKPIHDLETRLVDKEVLGLLDELEKEGQDDGQNQGGEEGPKEPQQNGGDPDSEEPQGGGGSSSSGSSSSSSRQQPRGVPGAEQQQGGEQPGGDPGAEQAAEKPKQFVDLYGKPVDEHGVPITRKYQGKERTSSRPEGITSYEWNRASKKQRKLAIERAEANAEAKRKDHADANKEAAGSDARLAMELGGLLEQFPVPRMPTTSERQPHRPKRVSTLFPYSAFVARPVTKKEIKQNAKANEALLKEWEKLRKAGCWDESMVREWSEVQAECRRTGP